MRFFVGQTSTIGSFSDKSDPGQQYSRRQKDRWALFAQCLHPHPLSHTFTNLQQTRELGSAWPRAKSNGRDRRG
jgi:hypothetical protein